jgi:Zn-finger nucleic acid-binding protein
MGDLVPRSCPVCRGGLSPEAGKLSLEVDVCPADHGAFVEGTRLKRIVAEETAVKIFDRLMNDQVPAEACPQCEAPMGHVSLGDLSAMACSNCGGLWFNRPDLLAHQQAWRSRAYGENSFSARSDVVGEATPRHTAEVISGVLTEYEMSLEE